MNDKNKGHICHVVFFTAVVAMILIIPSCRKLEIERIVKLGTGEVTNVTANSASITGIFMDIGEAEITQYGHCWDEHENPVAELNPKTNHGIRNSAGDFTSEIGGLQAATTYFVRAYAISDGKTSYGKNISFKTDNAVLPQVTTFTPGNIMFNSAICGGDVIANGGTEITMRGVCWNTSPNPLVTDFHTTDGGGTGPYSSNLTGLSALTTYFVRAYATNEGGTAYGDELTFRSAVPPVNDIDGNTYNSVSIGSQIWMKENLKTTRFRNGTSIPVVLDDNDWKALGSPAYCWYNNNADFKTEYGALYNWYALEAQQVCPSGWHVPSDQEWTVLIDHLGGLEVAGEKLKETGTVHWGSPNPASNETGFTALPGGYRNWSGNFLGMEEYGSWWTKTLVTADDAYHWDMYKDAGVVFKNTDARHLGFSVRCIRDE